MSKKYEKPQAKIVESEMGSIEAYSVAAVPVSIPVIADAIAGGGAIVAAHYSKYC